MASHDVSRIVVIRYTNYRGETALRRIIPKAIRFASTQWHPTEQWLLDAFDLDKEADRSFAIKDISEWMGQTMGTSSNTVRSP
jgi:predicted DNA-binding transcriptional regulator YafY